MNPTAQLKPHLPSWAYRIVDEADRAKRRHSGKRGPPLPSKSFETLRDGLNSMISDEFFRLWAQSGTKTKAELIIKKYVDHGFERPIKNARNKSANRPVRQRNADLVKARGAHGEMTLICDFVNAIHRDCGLQPIAITDVTTSYDNGMLKAMLEALTCYKEVRSAAIETFGRPAATRLEIISDAVKRCEALRMTGIAWIEIRIGIESAKRRNVTALWRD